MLKTQKCFQQKIHFSTILKVFHKFHTHKQQKMNKKIKKENTMQKTNIAL